MARLVIRADADANTGTGHLMRCLALAQGWKDAGGDLTLVTRCANPALLRRFSDEGAQLVSMLPGKDGEQLRACLDELGRNAWLALDGYQFDGDYQQQLKAAGHRFLYFDDECQLPKQYANVVLNQNLGAEKLPYAVTADIKLLLGVRYVLLRREFRTWKSWTRQIPARASKVLVTAGGSDPDDLTGLLLRALAQVAQTGIEAVVAVGASNPKAGELEALCRSLRLNARVEKDVADMSKLMAWADVAVAAAGSTCWEMASLGLPALVAIVAENQRRVAEQAQEHGVAINLGWRNALRPETIASALSSLLADAPARAAMSQRGRLLVDGNGVDRVVACIKEMMEPKA